MQESLNLNKSKIVKRIKHDVLQMEYGPEKYAYTEHVKEYEDEIMINKELKRKMFWRQ